MTRVNVVHGARVFTSKAHTNPHTPFCFLCSPAGCMFDKVARHFYDDTCVVPEKMEGESRLAFRFILPAEEEVFKVLSWKYTSMISALKKRKISQSIHFGVL